MNPSFANYWSAEVHTYRFEYTDAITPERIVPWPFNSDLGLIAVCHGVVVVTAVL